MARTAAQQAAFEKCVAARNKAKVKMSPPEYVEAPKEEAPPEPEPAPAPEPAPEPEVPVVPEAPPNTDEDSDFEILDGNELVEILSKQQKDLESVRAELKALQETHTTSYTGLNSRYEDLSESFKKARIQAAHSINFVD